MIRIMESHPERYPDHLRENYATGWLVSRSKLAVIRPWQVESVGCCALIEMESECRGT